MDYKELVETYRSYADRWERGEQILLTGEMRLQNTMRDAADAIETLLEERDVAVEDLTKICEDSPDVCLYCKHMPCTEKHGRCIGWQWRGPQKGENHD